ncbi:MAG: DUF1573 domain-containing protein [Lacinutrix sp.]|uniref:DUF1573 domain-containing protein n=1 Tax=Lacinutrix sp. TaxID=1937692 RepID=UPI00309B349E
MKKVVVLFSALCMIALTSCKEDASSKVDDSKVAEAAVRDEAASKFPVIEFDRTEHDFGEIINGTPVETVFTYKNTGESPLVITDVKSSCGCTIPKDWSREPLAPGAEGKFTVKFNGKGNNKVSKAVTVTANTEKGREVVKISAFIKPDPNAPASAAKTPNASSVMKPAANPAVTAPVKSSTQPGHEGHNHD